MIELNIHSWLAVNLCNEGLPPGGIFEQMAFNHNLHDKQGWHIALSSCKFREK